MTTEFDIMKQLATALKILYRKGCKQGWHDNYQTEMEISSSVLSEYENDFGPILLHSYAFFHNPSSECWEEYVDGVKTRSMHYCAEDNYGFYPYFSDKEDSEWIPGKLDGKIRALPEDLKQYVKETNE